MNGTKKTKLVCFGIIGIFAALAVISVLLSGNVLINYDNSDYLDKNSNTRIAMNIIEDKFGMTGNIQAMVKGIDSQEADEVADELEQMDNVLSVSFDAKDSAYYKDGSALFVILVDGDDYSDNAKLVAADAQKLLEARYDETYFGGTAIEKQQLQASITSEMTRILIVALALVVVILLITSKSWLEPFILLAASGVAVVINRGTNVMFGEISYITNSVAAILQLALSIDYSIILIHTYRAQKQKTPGTAQAMKDAIRSCLKPVSASGLTTIAGLLALLFMSFRIGFDIGIVLMKGIVISAVVAMTLFPALILVFDGLLEKTAKREFVPHGTAFAKLAAKAGRFIVPCALVLIAVCGYLQSGIGYNFTDTKAGNEAIREAFGQNNTVVIVYPCLEDSDDKESAFAQKLEAYKTAAGNPVLTDYYAYSNTVRESYDIDKAIDEMELSEHDAKLLYTMYHLYKDPEVVKLTNREFIDLANDIAVNDEDAVDMVGDDTLKSLQTLRLIGDVMNGENTAEQFHTALTTGVMADRELDLFSVEQMYGMMQYEQLKSGKVSFKTMLAFMIKASSDENVSGAFSKQTVTKLKELQAGIAKFEAAAAQNPAMLQAPEYAALGKAVSASYGYKDFIPALKQIGAALSGQPVKVDVEDAMMQQLYIMYFREDGLLNASVKGSDFVSFVLAADEQNEFVHTRVSEENRDRLLDMQNVYDFLCDTKTRTYEQLNEAMTGLEDSLLSENGTKQDIDNVSGVFIKYAVINDMDLTYPILACDLVDFVTDNMDNGGLIDKKMSDKNRKKVYDAQDDIKRAEDLFIADGVSRMIISTDLPNESDETTLFVEYLNGAVPETFGSGAYAAGEICTIYDMQQAFGDDVKMINIFTIVAVFVIVLVIFRSLSLPVVLVAVIQGAIWIALSSGLISGDPVFFMSYIVATCILMGATIDYGILLSSNYVAYRSTLDKREALAKSLEAAMPTVFSSGMILTVCGFVIAFLSSQIAISTVGLLIGKGALASVILITLVLPSVLYTLDKFIMLLSIKSKKA